MKKRYSLILLGIVISPFVLGAFIYDAYHSNATSNTLRAQVPTFPVVQEVDSTFIPTPQRTDNKEIWKIAKRVSQRISRTKYLKVDFKDDFKIENFEVFFDNYSKAFGLRSEDEMKLIAKDEVSVKYQQYYKGIEVKAGSYAITQLRNGFYILSA